MRRVQGKDVERRVWTPTLAKGANVGHPEICFRVRLRAADKIVRPTFVLLRLYCVDEKESWEIESEGTGFVFGGSLSGAGVSGDFGSGD